MQVPPLTDMDGQRHDQVNASGVENNDDEEEYDRNSASRSWLMMLATTGPLFAACVILGFCCFSGDIQQSNFLLRLSSSEESDGPKLWLALSGFCLDIGSATNCSISPLNTFYENAYNRSEDSVGELREHLPADFSTEATLLLVSFVLIGVSAVFTAWASLDLRKAQFLAREDRRGWVTEWLAARVGFSEVHEQEVRLTADQRLEMLGVFFAAAGVTSGMAGAGSLSSGTAAANATVNALASNIETDFTQSGEGAALSLVYASQACAGFNILLEVLILAYDGLLRRVRFEYESLIDGMSPYLKFQTTC